MALFDERLGVGETAVLGINGFVVGNIIAHVDLGAVVGG